jgi:hypothetical protein
MIKVLRIILEQSYFKYENNFYKPKNLLCYEILSIRDNRNLHSGRRKPRNKTHYDSIVDVVLIINKIKLTQRITVGTSNMQHKSLLFTIREENNDKISYLDMNISNRQGNIATDYRKTTGATKSSQ